MPARHHLPSEEFMSWSFTAAAWFLRELGGFDRLARVTLLRPTREHFPLTGSEGHERAAELFEMVREHAGLSAWPCRLEQHEDMPTSAIAGTCGYDEEAGEHVITYSARLLQDTQGLVATFAHELGHVLLASARETAPGGPSAGEPATDLAAIFLGFGIFMANAAIRHEVEDAALFGPGGEQGYLAEEQAAWLLALFVLLRKQDSKVVSAHLNTNPRSYLAAALGELEGNKRAAVEALREVHASHGQARSFLLRRDS